MSLAPALVRLVLDTAEADDDDAWELACNLLDESDLAQARRAAWDATLFAARILLRLRRDDPDLSDVDTLVADWGLSLATGVPLP